MFLTVAVLLAGYVYYLRTSKLYRSLYDCWVLLVLKELVET
jgi:hypothetical protein